MIIGLQVRHFKAYRNINYIPIGNEHNFIAYSGENGAGKSSILEALDTFLNYKQWLLTKNTSASDSYICPLCLIPKEKVTRLTSYFEIISEFFWELEQKDKKDNFFSVRNSLKSKFRDSHYLVFIGENSERKLVVPFGGQIKQALLDTLDSSFTEKKFLKELKSLYSYVYIPVEIDSENFTKIETVEMQKIFDKEVVDEIRNTLKPADIANINSKLDLFVNKLEDKLDEKYYYDTGDVGTKKLTQTALVDTVLEMYFKKRVLMKGVRDNPKLSKKMSELSAGEKREALINLVYVFLKDAKDRDEMIVIGIDEPENSLHTSICYEQFEKLKKIATYAQVLLTTHWYGFLPIVDRGLVHFLKSEEKTNSKGVIEEGIIFYEEVDLFRYHYQAKKLPKGFSLKSTNDLVQSIFHSMRSKNQYNWIICEGASDKIYLDYFFKDIETKVRLKIIPVGGVELVKKFFKYLSLPLSENISDTKCGKVFCLTDTDSNLRKKDIDQHDDLKERLILKRLAQGKDNTTALVKFEIEEKQEPLDIEKSLNPVVFMKVIENRNYDAKYHITEDDIINAKGNTTITNLRNFEIDTFFTSEVIKNQFALDYVQVMEGIESPEEYIPNWVTEIYEFFLHETTKTIND